MPFCTRCGVEVSSPATECPLCSAPLNEINSGGLRETNLLFPDRDPVVQSTVRDAMNQTKRMIWLFLSAFFITGFVINLAIVSIVPGSFVWARYVLSSILIGWVIVSLLMFILNRPLLFGVLFYLASALFLFALDSFDGRISWYFTLSLPILTAMCATISVVAFSISHSREKGFNILAFGFIGVGVFCIVVDLLVTFFTRGYVRPGWSLIVVASVAPISMLFLYLHYLMRKRIQFRRFFHM